MLVVVMVFRRHVGLPPVLANKALADFLGDCGFEYDFSGFEIFLLPSRVHGRARVR